MTWNDLNTLKKWIRQISRFRTCKIDDVLIHSNLWYEGEHSCNTKHLFLARGFRKCRPTISVKSSFFTKPKIWLFIKQQGAYAFSKITKLDDKTSKHLSWFRYFFLSVSDIYKGSTLFPSVTPGYHVTQYDKSSLSFTSLVDSGQNCIFTMHPLQSWSNWKQCYHNEMLWNFS